VTAAMLLESWDVGRECAARHLTVINTRNKNSKTRHAQFPKQNILFKSCPNAFRAIDIPLPDPVCD